MIVSIIPPLFFKKKDQVVLSYRAALYKGLVIFIGQQYLYYLPIENHIEENN